MDKSVDDFLSLLVNGDTKSPSTPEEALMSKLASENKSLSEDKMSELREELEAMDLEDLAALAGELSGEKTAAAEAPEAEEEFDETRINEALDNMSALELLAILNPDLDKTASEDFDEDELQVLSEITAGEYIDAVGEEMEKEASEQGEEYDPNFEAGAIFGQGAAYGLMETLNSMNEDIEKTAAKEELVDYLEDVLEKEAGAKTEAVTKMLRRIGAKGREWGGTYNAYLRAPLRAGKAISAGRSTPAPTGQQIKAILGSLGAKATIPAAAGGVGVAGYSAIRGRKNK